MTLLKFIFTEKCTNCGKRIEKAAQYCRHCGSGRASSWRQCTGCGVSVAADSAFCWGCKANLHAQPRDQIFSDRWRRTPGVFATRITIETPQERLRDGVQVDEGTIGGLYGNGVLKTELGSGYHELSSFWDRLTGRQSGDSLEAVIAVNDPVCGLVSLPGSMNLHTKDFTAVEAALLVKVRLEDLGLFARQMMPNGTETVRDDDLLLPFHSRIADVLRRYLSRLDVAEVARSPELRHEMEAALGRELPELMKQKGLRFCGIEDIRLDSEQITRVREAEGGLAQTARELAWARKKRELEQSDELSRFKDEFSFKEQLDRWTHEYTLTSMEREHIIAMRRIQQEKEQKIAHSHAVGGVQLTEQEYKLELARREHEARLAREKLEHEQDMAELRGIRDLQQSSMGWLDRRKMEKDAAETENKIKLGQGLRDVPSATVAGVLGKDGGDHVIRALEMLRPLPDVVILPTQPPGHPPPSPMQPGQYPGSYSAPSYAPGFGPGYAPGFGPGYAPGFTPSYMQGGHPTMTAFGSTRLEDLAQRYLPAVGVVVAGLETANAIPMGTAWIASGRHVLVTNAHVALAVAEAQQQAGMDISVVFSGQSQPYRVLRAVIHPEYAQGRAQGHVIPSNDVALLEMDSLPPHPGLPLADRHRLRGLRPLQTVAYLGFPMENLAGGGTSLARPQAVSKKGCINSLKDWTLAACLDPDHSRLIEHDMGVAGGASGSPLFDENGFVVGIVSAGNMEHLIDPQTKRPRRFPSGVLLNFAQRLDVLLDWMRW